MAICSGFWFGLVTPVLGVPCPRVKADSNDRARTFRATERRDFDTTHLRLSRRSFLGGPLVRDFLSNFENGKDCTPVCPPPPWRRVPSGPPPRVDQESCESLT